MAWHSKENAKHFGRSQSASECLNRQNLRLVGFSYGLPLILLALHGLLQALADKPPDGILKSWLSEIDSVSSVLFYLTFCSLLLITIGLYVLSLRRTRQFDELRMKETSSHFQSHRK
jgi:nitrate reductase gamma subunit